MGLNTRRAGYAALVLAAVLLPLRSPHRATLEVRADRNALLDTLNYLHRQAENRWAMLSMRDSALAMIPKIPPHAQTPPVHMGGFGPNASSPGTEAYVAGTWRRLGVTDPNVRVGVFVYKGSMVEWAVYAGALISDSGDTTTCVAVAAAGTMANGTIVTRNSELSDALGPCGLYAVFGRPGPQVRRWLEETRYAMARSFDWHERPPDYHDGQFPWAYWFNTDTGTVNPEPSALVRMFRFVSEDALLLAPYEFGTAGLHCTNGDAGECSTSVLHPSLRLPPADIPTDLTISSSAMQPDVVTLATVRLPRAQFITGMINAFGRERFRNFWRSTQPMDQAFESAFGRPLGAWTAEWANDTWRSSFRAKYMGAGIALGPTFRWSWVPMMLVWIALALLIAARIGMRRRS